MKVVILAGGLGTRLSEETSTRPKPMVEIGGFPLLYHLMQMYSAAGFHEFAVALGYKQEVVKDYFRSLHATSNDLTVDFTNGSIAYHEHAKLNWKVHLVDTGSSTMTGGRIKRGCARRLRSGTSRFFARMGTGWYLSRRHREARSPFDQASAGATGDRDRRPSPGPRSEPARDRR